MGALTSIKRQPRKTFHIKTNPLYITAFVYQTYGNVFQSGRLISSKRKTMEQNTIASLTLRRISKRPPRFYHISGVFGQRTKQLNIRVIQCICVKQNYTEN